MNVYEFGTENRRKLLFFQGSCTCWRDYMPSIELLAQQFHVIVPAFEGHDPEEKTDFISVEKTVSDTTDYLSEHGHTSLYAVYGLSMGGGMALRLLAEQRIPVEKVIIDAGTAPYELPYWFTRLILLRDYLMIQLIRSNIRIFKLFFDPKRWAAESSDTEADYKAMFDFLKGLSRKTIWHVFDSANNYDMPIPMPEPSTEIRYWYGSLERKSRKRDIRWMQKYVAGVQMREFPDMEHGELVLVHPDRFYETAIEFLNHKSAPKTPKTDVTGLQLVENQ